MSATSRQLLPGLSLLRRVAVPDRYRQAPAPAGGGACTASVQALSAARSSPSARAVLRLRALVVCVSFAVCLPAASRWELSSNWTVRAVATLVSVAVGRAALPRAVHAAVTPPGMAAQGGSASQRSAVLVAPAAGVCAPARWAEQIAPGFDGRWLYLEQCSLSC